MARNLDAKCKQCRRAGEKLFLKGERCDSPKCGIVKRNYPPGVHGQKGKRRQSDFGMQLLEKQKAKKQYGLMEKQFKLTFDKAKTQSGNAGENFLRLLETRLDSVVLNLNWADSHDQARQIINHGHIKVNDKKVDIPSFQVKEGDIVKIKEGSRRHKYFTNLKEKVSKMDKSKVPGWLFLNPEELSGKVLHLPSMKDAKTNINIQMIIEYYSK